MSRSIDRMKGTVLTFDFVIEELKKYYSSTSPKNAYREVKNYLVKNGFEHLKDSDYRHLEFSLEETFALVCDFSGNNRWFSLSLNKLNLSPNMPVIDVSKEIKDLYGLEE